MEDFEDPSLVFHFSSRASGSLSYRYVDFEYAKIKLHFPELICIDITTQYSKQQDLVAGSQPDICRGRGLVCLIAAMLHLGIECKPYI